MRADAGIAHVDAPVLICLSSISHPALILVSRAADAASVTIRD
jgi:hypothetical protein